MDASGGALNRVAAAPRPSTSVHPPLGRAHYPFRVLLASTRAPLSLMRSCRAGDPSALVLDPSASTVAASTTMTKRSKCVSYKYTGRERGIAFQQSSGKSPARDIPKQLVWKKGERLGITFVEKQGGSGVFVKKTAKRSLAVLTGHELARVQGIPVDTLDISSVLRVLQAVPSLCLLEFVPRSAPVTIAQLSAEMKRSGVQPGMILSSIDGDSVLGASLKEVCDRIEKATGSHPLNLEFVVGENNCARESIGKSAASEHLSPQQQAQMLRKANVRNGMSVAAVLAALTF